MYLDWEQKKSKFTDDEDGAAISTSEFYFSSVSISIVVGFIFKDMPNLGLHPSQERHI